MQKEEGLMRMPRMSPSLVLPVSRAFGLEAPLRSWVVILDGLGLGR